MAVTNQPARFLPSEFQTGVCDCCEDLSVCCLGCFCYMCLGCTIASDMGECCMFGTGYPIRSVYRTRYNIQVSVRPQRRRVSCSYRFNSKTGSSLWDHVIHVLQTSDHLIIFSDSKLALNY
uniref:Placenta associated 8, tandem duplicate 1 n=1 Tax=Oryzias melastigma TaxID=30732 RepID=A0A3B3CG56_ORYME